MKIKKFCTFWKKKKSGSKYAQCACKEASYLFELVFTKSGHQKDYSIGGILQTYLQI